MGQAFVKLTNNKPRESEKERKTSTKMEPFPSATLAHLRNKQTKPKQQRVTVRVLRQVQANEQYELNGSVSDWGV